MKLVPATLAVLLAGSLSAMAHDIPAEVAKSPPAGAFKAVSSLVKLPDFLPGMGQLFVDPATLPAGPFLAYDHDGKLVSTIYMLPTKDLNPDKRFEDIAAPGGNVDHVDVYYNAGHRASKNRTSMSCCGMFPRPTKQGSPSDPYAQARDRGRRGFPRRPRHQAGGRRWR